MELLKTCPAPRGLRVGGHCEGFLNIFGLCLHGLCKGPPPVPPPPRLDRLQRRHAILLSPPLPNPFAHAKPNDSPYLSPQRRAASRGVDVDCIPPPPPTRPCPNYTAQRHGTGGIIGLWSIRSVATECVHRIRPPFTSHVCRSAHPNVTVLLWRCHAGLVLLFFTRKGDKRPLPLESTTPLWSMRRSDTPFPRWGRSEQGGGFMCWCSVLNVDCGQSAHGIRGTGITVQCPAAIALALLGRQIDLHIDRFKVGFAHEVLGDK